jgi:hypothetical protein
LYSTTCGSPKPALYKGFVFLYRFDDFAEFIGILHQRIQIITKILMTTSCLAPVISSLKRIATGYWKPTVIPGTSSSALLIFSEIRESFGGSPFFFVFQNDHHIRSIHRHRVGRDFSTSYFGNHFFHFRKTCFQDMSGFLGTFNRGRQITSR